MTPYKHQQQSLDRLASTNIFFDMSEPGTGKTGVHLWSFARRHAASRKPGLVLASRSLLNAAWAADAKSFTPDLRISVATADNRAKAFAAPADLYITNHDAVNWLIKQDKAFHRRFGHIIVDESTAFKHATSNRSRALAKLRKNFETCDLLSGEPMPNGVLDMWHQAYLLDGGERLGKSYYGFRNNVCDAVQTGPQANMVTWTPRDHAEQAVAARMADISIRHKLEECVDMPKRIVREVIFDLSPSHRAIYNKMEKDSTVDVDHRTITALNGAILWTKLLQIASGSVYGAGATAAVSDQRYELVLDLVEEAPFSIVLFQWQHQRDKLEAAARHRKISFRTIDGDTSDKERLSIVESYQQGFFRVLFGHPKSMAHGLTLTRGVRTIWASPTIDLEWWTQANRRIFRIGQTKRTETIVVIARDTKDQLAYDRCMGKQVNAAMLLNAIKEFQQ